MSVPIRMTFHQEGQRSDAASVARITDDLFDGRAPPGVVSGTELQVYGRCMNEDARESWAPSACTLPTAELPLRLAEFDGLFAGGVRAVHRVSSTRVTLVFDPAPGRAELLRDVARRETQCCSFFTFAVEDLDPLRLDVTVPPEHVGVLDGLAERASQLSGAAG